LNSFYCQENSKLKVVLDAGHGGEDPGAVNRKLGLKEKDIALEICLRAEKILLKNNEIEVFLTRKSDYFIPVYQRAEIANKQKANLFLSVHLNSSENVSPYGTETFVMGLSKSKSNLEVAKKENSVITLEKDYKTKYEGFDPNSPESLIGLTLLQEQYLDQSVRLASKLQYQYTKNLERYNRSVKQDVFLVLHKVAMPSVLTELGFLSNDEEAILKHGFARK
jgi:N-acetylmuramoyl-L-alanine amidase